jgi:hypothetical protein
LIGGCSERERSREKGLDALRERLQDLKITVSRNDGVFTANSYSEPLFCFERPTLDDLKAVVEDTLTSYVKNFYHVENAKVTLANQPVEIPSVPIERVVPTSELKPSFDRELVPAG